MLKGGTKLLKGGTKLLKGGTKLLKGGTKLLKGGTKLLKGGTKLLKGGTKLLKGGTKSLGWATGGGGRTTPPTPPGYGPADYGNPLEALSGAEVYQRYRFRPETIIYIVGIVQDVIVRPTKRSCALPPVIMVLAALRLLACGSFYQVVSDTIRISKTSIWKAVHEVTGRLAR